jgi:HAD superfamily hydrolase (TIGR01459 family)
VILVSNAPVPKERVALMLEARAVPRDAFDDIVASGEIALRHIADKGYTRLYAIGPTERDAATFARLPARPVALGEAQAILCTGLNDDRTETADDYRALLERARALKLPLVCANPDLIVDVGGQQYLCAGAIADLYERMDGEVYWAGKPHANAYEAALTAAEAARGASVERARILAIGDSLRTDLKGAEAAGVDAIFIASGIHRDETMGTGELSPEKLALLFAPPAPPALAVMGKLVW